MKSKPFRKSLKNCQLLESLRKHLHLRRKRRESDNTDKPNHKSMEDKKKREKAHLATRALQDPNQRKKRQKREPWQLLLGTSYQLLFIYTVMMTNLLQESSFEVDLDAGTEGVSSSRFYDSETMPERKCVCMWEYIRTLSWFADVLAYACVICTSVFINCVCIRNGCKNLDFLYFNRLYNFFLDFLYFNRLYNFFSCSYVLFTFALDFLFIIVPYSNNYQLQTRYRV